MKHSLLFLLLFGASANVFGQVYLGVSAGPDLSFWKWEIKNLQTNIDYEPAIGGRGAITGAWQIKPWVATKVALGVHLKKNKGGDFTQEDGSVAGTYREYYQYLEGSFALELSPLKKARNFYASVGFTYGNLQKAWYRGSNNTVKTYKDLNYFNRNAPSLDYGAGWRFPIKGEGRLELQVGAQHNLSALDNLNNVDSWVRSLMVQIGYSHRI